MENIMKWFKKCSPIIWRPMHCQWLVESRTLACHENQRQVPAGRENCQSQRFSIPIHQPLLRIHTRSNNCSSTWMNNYYLTYRCDYLEMFFYQKHSSTTKARGQGWTKINMHTRPVSCLTYIWYLELMPEWHIYHFLSDVNTGSYHSYLNPPWSSLNTLRNGRNGFSIH